VGAGTRQLQPPVQRKLHQTIKKVTADTETLSYNTAIAAMMEYVNLVREAGTTGGATTRGAIEPLLILLAPYAPHLCEELWDRLGHKDSIFAQARWPSFDERLTTAGDVEIAVQVNGKLRGRITVPRGSTEAQVVARALAEEGVKRFVDGNAVKKTIYVQDRLVNLVV